MLNRKLFYETHALLLRIIRNSNMNEKEKEYRKNKANKKLLKMLKDEKLDNHYYSLAHELKTYELLKKYGNIIIAEDSKNSEGPDLLLDKYHIECVCCSPGGTIRELEKYRTNEYRKSIVCDYNKKLEIILPRITSSLNEKSNKFTIYINKRSNKK